MIINFRTILMYIPYLYDFH